MKTKAWYAVAVVLGIGLGGVFSHVAVRQLPRKMPDNPKGVQGAAYIILNAKCADCHDSQRKRPFYAALPVIGALVNADCDKGVRHWEPTDRRFLGTNNVMEGEVAAARIPQAALAKLGYALDDGMMPPHKYRAVHWGSGLSASEKGILRKWILDSRTAWLAQWGIKEGADKTVQPIPDAIPADAAKAALGRRLYNDKRLSSDNTVACASCHDFGKGGTDNERFASGVRGQKGGVSAPTVFNAAFNIRQFWDGRAADLAQQAGGPPLNPVEMASRDWKQITDKLNADAELVAAFTAVYPEGFSEKTICGAIAEYEKQLLTPGSRFDEFLKGKKDALTEAEQKGRAAFMKRRCDQCHFGPSMGSQSFEYVDLKADPFAGRKLTDGDKGLASFTKNLADLKRFKVPNLRNIALTSPYLHDGSLATLPEAVEFMLKYQIGVTAPDKAEVSAVDAFLRTLTGTIPKP